MIACKHALIVAMAMAGVDAATACTKIPTDANSVLSLALDSLPAPAVVLGDTLRDSTGRAAPLHATVYNFQGSVISNAPLTFEALDRGVTVDKVTGFAIGDSLRQTPARILISVGSLQAILQGGILRPKSIDLTRGPPWLGHRSAGITFAYSRSLRHGNQPSRHRRGSPGSAGGGGSATGSGVSGKGGGVG